jgi:hypothetical protein
MPSARARQFSGGLVGHFDTSTSRKTLVAFVHSIGFAASIAAEGRANARRLCMIVS